MTLEHVQSGTAFRPSARDWTDMCDAVKWVKQYRQLVDGGNVPRVDVNDCRVRLKASGIGSARRAGDPVKAGAITKIDSRTRWIAGTEVYQPSYAYGVAPWGVCVGPVAVDGWVDVAFAGCVPCYVTITDEYHRFVTVSNSTHLCVSTAALDGGGEIVLKPSGTTPDERLCLVRLGPVALGGPIFRAPDWSGSFVLGASPYDMPLLPMFNDDSLFTYAAGTPDTITCNRKGLYRVSIALYATRSGGVATDTIYANVTRSTSYGATSDGVVPVTPYVLGGIMRDSGIMYLSPTDILSWRAVYTGGTWTTQPGGAYDFTVELLQDLT
jgi:hypothetical protein